MRRSGFEAAPTHSKSFTGKHLRQAIDPETA